MDFLNINIVWLGSLALRVVIGVIFIVHGKQKMGSWKATPGEPMSGLMKILSVAEPAGGAVLILGFLTQLPFIGILSQLAVIGLALVMISAIWFKVTKWNVPFTVQSSTGWEFDLVILAGLIAIFFSV